MRYLVDVESFSPVNLGDAGAWAYAQHPETDVLCVCWVSLLPHPETAVVHRWKPGDPPPRFQADDCCCAWGDFDRVMWEHILTPRFNWPRMRRWENLMVRAYYGNLPGKLATAAKVLAASQLKDDAGHRLMLRLSRPAKASAASNDARRHHDPAALRALMDYCAQDVRAEAAVEPMLPQLPASEQRVAEVDATITRRGVQVDLRLVHALRDAATGYADRLREDLRQLTGGAVETETKLPAFAAWLRTQGVTVATGKGAMDKEAVLGHLQHLDPESPAAKALNIRRELGKSSLSKLDALLTATCSDGRVRGTLQHYGAHQTGRWAGRIVQVQNLPKGILDSERMETYHLARDAVLSGDLEWMVGLYGTSIMDVFASLIRCCFIPKPGHVLATADWNAIEPRVVAWMAQAKQLLQVFNDGVDPYIAAAAMALNIDRGMVRKSDRNKLGKPQVIGCGYGMGVNKLADTFHIDHATAKICVDTFRQRLAPEVPQLWRAVERAMLQAINNRGQVFGVSCLHCKADGRHLYIRLPSGRCLWYRDVNLQDGAYGPEIHFMAEEQGQWVDTKTWGGTAVENTDQAISSDLLRETLITAEAEGLAPVMHVHDEVICEVPEATAERDMARLVAIMEQVPAWATGLPIVAKPDIRAFYVK